jgi:hypothetical protein
MDDDAIECVLLPCQECGTSILVRLIDDVARAPESCREHQ